MNAKAFMELRFIDLFDIRSLLRIKLCKKAHNTGTMAAYKFNILLLLICENTEKK